MPLPVILGKIENTQRIAVGKRIRELPRLRKCYGEGNWRKLKGIATVRLSDGTLHRAEVHWYEMTRVGKKEIKIKRLLT